MVDETLRLTRQIDSCINTQKIALHTPRRDEMIESEDSSEALAVLKPAMYVRIMSQSMIHMREDIENVFSSYLERFEGSPDKEGLLKDMFARFFAEVDRSQSVEPHI